MALKKKKKKRCPPVGGPEAVPTGKLRPCLGAGSGRALAGVRTGGASLDSWLGAWQARGIRESGENADRAIQPLPTLVTALRGWGPGHTRRVSRWGATAQGCRRDPPGHQSVGTSSWDSSLLIPDLGPLIRILLVLISGTGC